MRSSKKYTWAEIKEKFTIYEDAAILALNKPAGLSVVGDRIELDIMKLGKEAGEKLHPVHRIDKETSGLILFAKNPIIHAELAYQFAKRTVEKKYLAITKSVHLPKQGTINLPLSVGRKNKIRVATLRNNIVYDNEKKYWSVLAENILANVKNYPSSTNIDNIWNNEKYTLLLINPITGRQHQIRVHLAWIGYPIYGDPLFNKNDSSERTYLHSWSIVFNANWLNNAPTEIKAPPNEDFWAPISENLSVDKAHTLLTNS